MLCVYWQNHFDAPRLTAGLRCVDTSIWWRDVRRPPPYANAGLSMPIAVRYPHFTSSETRLISNSWPRHIRHHLLRVHLPASNSLRHETTTRNTELPLGCSATGQERLPQVRNMQRALFPLSQFIKMTHPAQLCTESTDER